MKKIFIMCVLFILAFLTVACNLQVHNEYSAASCQHILASLVQEDKLLNSTQTLYLQQQQLNKIGTIVPASKGNTGINPPVSYFVIDNINNTGYYYVTGGMYTEEWYGPYSGELPAKCLARGK
jgi:hypothetical protein